MALPRAGSAGQDSVRRHNGQQGYMRHHRESLTLGGITERRGLSEDGSHKGGGSEPD